MKGIMERCGWYREEHKILGEKKIRWHKDGFEIPEKEAYYIVKETIDTMKGGIFNEQGEEETKDGVEMPTVQ